MRSFILSAALFALPLAAPAARAGDVAPSRAATDKCVWEPLPGNSAGLAAWVQRCDFGFRKINLEFADNKLFIRYSDGGDPDPLIEVFDIRPGETSDAALKRIFAEKTAKAIAKHCRLVPWTESRAPAGVARFTFVPDVAYAKKLKAKADEIGDPVCGDWGEAPDGIQYFEVPSPDAKKLLFVRVGQDEPLFDEQTLRILPSP